MSATTEGCVLSMTCENQPIAEMLVPYVEGALAEAERAEVTDHLRHCPACREEARSLRDTIVGLRNVFSAGYRPRLSGHPGAEEFSAFVLEPQTLAEERLAAMRVHLLECDDCAAEAQMLRDMQKDLEGRVAPGGAPLVLPRALREEIEAAYPAGRPAQPRVEGAAALPFLERLSHMLSRFNWRPVLATGLAAVVLTFGFLFAYSGRNAEMAVETGAAGVAASPETGATPAPAAPAPVPPSEVPLLVEAGKADQTAQALDKEKIPYQNRDGKLYLSPADVERARKLLDQPEPDPGPAGQPEIAMVDQPSRDAAPADDARAEAVTEEKVAPPPPEPARPPAPAPVERPRVAAPAPEERPAASAPAPRAQTPRPQVTTPPAPVTRPARTTPPAPVTRPAQTTSPAQSTPPPRPRQEIASGGGAAPAAASTTVAKSAGTVASGRTAPVGETAPDPRPVSMTAANAPAGPSGGVTAEAADEADAMAAPTPMAQEGYASTRSSAGVKSNAEVQAPAAAAAPPPPALSRADSLEPRARQVATEGTVTIEEADDGTVRIVVRARRSLTAQEEEALRQRLRRELGLREGDTITVRQP